MDSSQNTRKHLLEYVFFNLSGNNTYISQSLLQPHVLEQSRKSNTCTLVQNVSWKYNPRFMDMYAQSVRVNHVPQIC